jgi:hypothetical protein
MGAGKSVDVNGPCQGRVLRHCPEKQKVAVAPQPGDSPASPLDSKD